MNRRKFKWNLKRPCAHCPFRTDIEPFLRKGRAREIVYSLTKKGDSFTCHETLGKGTKNRKHCAGAIIMLKKANLDNTVMQLAERLLGGLEVDLDSPVFDNPQKFIEAQEGK